MKNLFAILLFNLCFIYQAIAQSTALIPPPICSGNGNSGFGGAVGLSIHQRWEQSGGVVYFGFTNTGNFNDIFVIYISTGAPGRSSIDSSVDDDADPYRIAISNSNVSGYGSNIYFPDGFEVTHAVALDVNFAGLWSIPNTGIVGQNGLNFISSVTSTLSSPDQDNYEIYFNISDLGLPSGSFFYYVGLYVRSDGYSSDEGYGDGIAPNTHGADDIVFASYKVFNNTGDCDNILGNIESNQNSFDVNYIDGELNIKGTNDLLSIKVFDITGRLIQLKRNQIYGEVSIPLRLPDNQLYFVIVEGTSYKKIMKIIPN